MPTSDPRVARSRAAIAAAVLDVLAQDGLGAVTVERVARRAGLAKTTVYRHTPTRRDLITAALTSTFSAEPLIDSGDLRTDLITDLSALARALTDHHWARALLGLTEAAERDPELATLYEAAGEVSERQLYRIIERAVQRGTLPESTDVSTLVAALAGPVFFQRFFARRTPGIELIRWIVDSVLGPLLLSSTT